MQFSTALLALAATAASVVAVPSPEPEPVAEPAAELEKRANAIRVCANTNWNGPCVTYSPTWNQCQPFSALGLSGLGSWGPDPGVYCIWYNKPCGASDGVGSDTFTYPGFSTVPGYWQFNTQSWKCWW